jgi:hypothetical protein
MNPAEPQPTSTCGRPLGPLEELYWLYGRVTPFHFALSAEIDGHTELPEWRSGFALLQRKRQMLTVGVDPNSKGNLSFLSQSNSIPLRVVTDSTARWQDEMARELTEPFDSSAAPLIRAVLLYTHARCVLILVADHSILDGLSMAQIIPDLLRLMSGEDIAALPIPPPLEAYAGMPQTTWGHREIREAASESESPSIHLRQRGTLPTVHGLQLSAASTERLVAVTRGRGATLQAALCAALALAGHSHNNGWTDACIRLLVPINLREMVGLSNDPILALSVGVLHALPGHSPRLWDLAVLLREELRRYQSPETVITSGALVTSIVQHGLDASRAARFMIENFTSEGMVTNLGRLKFDTAIGRFKISRVWGPAVLTGVDNEQVIGAATVNGTLCLTHTSVSPFPNLLKTMETILFAEIDRDYR